MGFSQSTITAVNPPIYSGSQVYLTWQTTSPAGTWFQVYVNEALAWWGTSTRATIILPNNTAVRIDIGTVLPGEQQTSFSGSLPSAPERRVELQWLGGTFESSAIAGFLVYGSDNPGGYGNQPYGNGPYGEIDMKTPLANIAAYPSGISLDGYGFGGYGYGAYGFAASSYSYISSPLWSGIWSFVVIPYDSTGNNGTPTFIGATLKVPPREPALFTDRTRLHYSFNSSTHKATLTWNASPG